MRLYMFRASTNIPISSMEKVAENVGRIFGIDYSIFTGPVYGDVDNLTIDHLLKISDRFLERGEPVLAIVFTEEGVDDSSILGEASYPNRGAWVKWCADTKRATIMVVHEIGHLCDAYHCPNESCVMFYAYREHNKLTFNDLFCEKCRAIVKNSWVYNRLIQASTDRMRKRQVLPKIVKSPPLNLTKSTEEFAQTIYEGSIINDESPFPDWSLASINREEFIRRVRKHFERRR